LIGLSDVPIYLQGRDFDDTEVVQAAKNSLYWMFVELANQSKVWELRPLNSNASRR